LVRTLIEQGEDVNAAQGDGMTGLHWAAERADVAMLELLLEAGADVASGTRIGRYTPLHLASRRGDGQAVRLLLEAGSEVGAMTTNSGAMPLHIAAAAPGGEDAVAALLDYGAEVDAREGAAGQTPLMFAAAYDRVASIEVLLRAGADPSISTEAVDVLGRLWADRAANERFDEVIAAFRDADGGSDDWAPTPTQVQAAVAAQREVLRAQRDVVITDKDELAERTTVAQLGNAVETTRLPIRESLVRKTGGLTPLLHAAREGHLGAARALIQGGAEVDQVSPADATSPLLMAALNGHFDLAMVLLERGANPNLVASTDGSNPLFAVLQTQWAPKSNYPQPRAQDQQQTAYLELLSALLEAGADPNVPLKTHLWYWEYGFTRIGIDIKGATPFWRATFAQDLDAMRLLVAYGSDPHAPTTLPEVGLREARQQDGRIAQDSGLRPVPEGAPNAYPIHAAAGGGYLGLGAFSIRSVPNGFLPAVRYLVEEHGADLNVRDWWGYAPLHYAASRGDNELIRYMVEEGADVNAITRLGQSTADMARGGRAGYFQRVAFPETVELLQSLGSTLECMHTHFNGTGDVCPGAGSNDAVVPELGPGQPGTPPKDPPRPE
jgi:ankyrin repeat protein